MSFSPFNSKGQVGDIDAEVVAAMSPEEQEALADLLAPCRAAEQSEKIEQEARDKVRDLMSSYDRAVAHDLEMNKPADAVESVRAWSAATNPNLPKPKKQKVNTKARQALQNASDELATARLDWIRSQGILALKNRARADAIVAWMALQTPVTDLSQSRDYAARSQAQREANVAAGLPADGEKVLPVYLSPIDKLLHERGQQNRQKRVPDNLKSFPGSGKPRVADIYK